MTLLASLLISIYFLELLGACAITTLGWAGCRVLELPWLPSAPLWFAGYLFVYNCDRLYRDPSDQVNTPSRSFMESKLRPFRIALAIVAGSVMVTWILLTCRMFLFPVLVVAAGLSQIYSRPIPLLGIRLKNGRLKTLIVPAVITTVLVLWPLVESGRFSGWKPIVVFLWVLVPLTINSVIFDLRDIKGDRLYCVSTIATELGAPATRRLLLLLLSLCILVNFAIAVVQGPAAILVGSSSAILLWFAIDKVEKPLAMSVMADLFLFFPAAAEMLSRK
ncbi:MAG: UbiA family prenyltransferase [Verrucomicrobia bacterium]|nr:UbiA family prenyltransferase [Verrucomicrobiota bacterium]